MAFIVADINKEVTNGTVTHRGPHHHNGGSDLDDNGPATAISTWTGRAFDLVDISSWDESFWLEDIAQSLSTTARFGGHVKFYSVAEHSLRVCEWLRQAGHDTMTQLLGLHHDDTEAYVGDIPRPQKRLMKINDTDFSEYEHYMAVFHLFPWLGLEYTEERWAEVKKADYAVYLMERSERPQPATQSHAMVPGVACEMFLLRNERLMQDLNVQ
jgi:hypothetical protein